MVSRLSTNGNEKIGIGSSSVPAAPASSRGSSAAGGAGGRVGSPSTFGFAGGDLANAQDAVVPGDSQSHARLRIGVRPLQFLETQRDRMVDFGVGYSWQGAMDSRHRRPGIHGLYGTFAYQPVRLPIGDDWFFRLLVHGTAELAFHDGLGHLDVGGGGTGGATFELVGWTDGPVEDEDPDDDATFIGVATGEGGVGLTFEVGYHAVGPQAFWSITGGLTFRLPAAAGIAILWL